jgi:hypothetical protein
VEKVVPGNPSLQQVTGRQFGVEPAYGKAYAAAIPMSTFTLLPRTGHLPRVETPEELLAALFGL